MKSQFCKYSIRKYTKNKYFYYDTEKQLNTSNTIF